ncbi:DUF4328 domain-containing protein [Aquimarina sediminis]|uniref:DUF4328 domain-containing protein n=1 Tax=Aquimarina sediminis TaxID=2070536 RepID=UPI000CA06B6D|nr:DUF4328 domain-containing protein [Aquimarina sediminis]
MNELENIKTEGLIEKIEIWDNSKRAKYLINIFWIITGLTITGIISNYYELELLKNAQIEQYIDEGEANANDMRQGVIGIVQFIIYIISVVLFLNWFRRAYGNLHRLKISYLNHKETMAVWSWIIPIISLFRPVQIMTEIWTETQEKIKKMDSSYLIENGGFIIGLWWTLFIISNFIGKYVVKTAFKQDTIEQLIEGSRAMIISDLIQIPEALLVILIVFRLSKIESKLADEVKKSGGNIIYK